LLLADVVEAYRDLRDRSRPTSDASNEHYMARHLVRGLGERGVMTLTPHDIVAHCQMRKDEGAAQGSRFRTWSSRRDRCSST
jgi:hypothetical protein